jgi:hypothetical protein
MGPDYPSPLPEQETVEDYPGQYDNEYYTAALDDETPPPDSIVQRLADEFQRIPCAIDDWAMAVPLARIAMRVIAEEVERRGSKGLDLDPGETADWLRGEACMTKDVSDCCGAPVKVVSEKNPAGYTDWLVCTSCAKRCEAVEPNSNTTGQANQEN